MLPKTSRPTSGMKCPGKDPNHQKSRVPKKEATARPMRTPRAVRRRRGSILFPSGSPTEWSLDNGSAHFSKHRAWPESHPPTHDPDAQQGHHSDNVGRVVSACVEKDRAAVGDDLGSGPDERVVPHALTRGGGAGSSSRQEPATGSFATTRVFTASHPVPIHPVQMTTSVPVQTMAWLAWVPFFAAGG